MDQVDSSVNIYNDLTCTYMNTLSSSDDMNNITTPGNYSMKNANWPANSPTIITNAHHGYLRVEKVTIITTGEYEIVQTAAVITGGKVLSASRRQWAGSWSDWYYTYENDYFNKSYTTSYAGSAGGSTSITFDPPRYSNGVYLFTTNTRAAGAPYEFAGIGGMIIWGDRSKVFNSYGNTVSSISYSSTTGKYTVNFTSSNIWALSLILLNTWS